MTSTSAMAAEPRAPGRWTWPGRSRADTTALTTIYQHVKGVCLACSIGAGVGTPGVGGVGAGRGWSRNEPIGPTKAFWKETHPLGLFCLNHVGVLVSSPGQSPRCTPGALAGLSSGYAASSHSMLTLTSSQSEIAMTWPRSKDSPMDANSRDLHNR